MSSFSVARSLPFQHQQILSYEEAKWYQLGLSKDSSLYQSISHIFQLPQGIYTCGGLKISTFREGEGLKGGGTSFPCERLIQGLKSKDEKTQDCARTCLKNLCNQHLPIEINTEMELWKFAADFLFRVTSLERENAQNKKFLRAVDDLDNQFSTAVQCSGEDKKDALEDVETASENIVKRNKEVLSKVLKFEVDHEDKNYKELLSQVVSLFEGPSSLNANSDEIFQNLAHHLNGELANDLTAKSIAEGFKAFSQSDGFLSDVDTFQKVFEGIFEAIKMPKETRVLIDSLSSKLKEELQQNEDPDVINNKDVELRERFKVLSSLKRKDDLQEWEERSILYKVPDIQILSNESMKRINFLIAGGTKDMLRSELKTMVGEDNIDSMDEYLEKVEVYGYNHETLISQLYENKPHEDNGLLTLWNEENENFLGKDLRYAHPLTKQIYNLRIKKCNKTEKVIRFDLEGGSILKVVPQIGNKNPENYSIHLETKETYAIESFKRGSFNTDEKISIKQNDMSISGILPEGEYTFKGTKSISKNCTKTQLDYARVSYYIYMYDDKSKPFLITLDNQNCKDDNIVASTFKAVKEFVVGNKKLPYPEVPKEESIVFQLRRTSKEYIVVKTVNIEDAKIDRTKLNEVIKIQKGDANEDRRRLLQEIDERLKKIQAGLIEAHGGELFLKLLDNLIENRLRKVDISLIKGKIPEIFSQLEEVCSKINQESKMMSLPETLLREVVLKANYARLAQKEKSMSTATIMDLLGQAASHTDKIAGKSMILFLGNTGAGKSTSINYLMGSKMEYFTNKIGNKVIRCREGDKRETPKIGQSLGESETLYTSGYPFSNERNREGIVFADCPGFNDTRGGDYEICANLSIDQAVERSKEIKSIVVVIPLSSFSSDRANPVIELMETVRERFPGAFEQKNLSSLHLLVTKEVNCNPEFAKKFREGTVIQEFLAEVTNKEKQLQEKGVDKSDFQMQVTEQRGQIWRQLSRMYDAKQVKLVDIKDQKAREILNESYINHSHSISKQGYVKAMQGADMEKKFGDAIELAAHTWTGIFNSYLESLKQVEDKDREILDIEKEIERVKSFREKCQNQLENRKELEKKYQEIIETIEKNASIEGSNIQGLPKDLEEAIQGAKRQEISQIELDIKEKDEEFRIANQVLTKKTQELDSLQNQQKSLETKKSSLEKEVSHLAEGSTKKDLFTYKRDPEQHCFSHSVSEEARKKAHESMSEVPDSERGETVDNGPWKNVTGTFHVDPIISVDYRLVPEKGNDDFQSQLMKGGIASLGKYEAKIEMKHCCFKYAAKTAGDGKRVKYAFDACYEKGRELPYLNITYTIPNESFNESTIINKNAEIKALNEKIAYLLLNIKEKEQEKKESGIRVDDVKKLLENKKSALLVIKQSSGFNIKGISQKILEKAKEQKINVLEMMQNDDKDIKNKNEEERQHLERKNAFSNKREEIIKSSKRTALLLYEEKETIRRLRSFTDLILKGQNESEKDPSGFMTRSRMLETCKDFKESYDIHFDLIQKRAECDLGLI